MNKVNYPIRKSRFSLLSVGLLGFVLAACSQASSSPSVSRSSPRATPAGQTVSQAPPTVTISPTDGSAGVGLDLPLVVSASNATITSVTVTENGSPVSLNWATSRANSNWSYSGGLDLDSSYSVMATAEVPSGAETIANSNFSTITTANRLLTTVQYLNTGQTVGVGMPIELTFNTPIPAADQPAVIAHVAVVSTPAQPGGWYWFDNEDVHYRPENFWLPGTTVTINANLKGVNAGNGYWGLADWNLSFTVGPEHVTLVNTQTRQMQVYNGDPANGGTLLYTWPTNTGKSGFYTINGTLVVLYQEPVVDMESCPTFNTEAACVPGGSSYYNENVYEDTAVSSDGYFIHAAPWACGGNTCNYVSDSNSSHGCINLSNGNATTYYAWSQIGDVVEVSGSPLEASYSDGEGDWQLPWVDFVPGGQDVLSS